MMPLNLMLKAGWHRLLVDVAGLLLAGAIVVALIVPESFDERMLVLAPYFGILTIVYFATASLFAVNRPVWRFTNLADLSVVGLAIVVSLLVTTGVGFLVNRLDGVFRSLPVLQGFIAVFWSWLVRGVFVLRWRWLSRRRRLNDAPPDTTKSELSHLLVVGVNELANLYISGIAEFAGGPAEIAGILSQEERHAGRLIQQCKVLGSPVDIATILGELGTHGIMIDTIVIAMPWEKLRRDSREALLETERGGDIELVFLSDQLALNRSGKRKSADPDRRETGLGTIEGIREPSGRSEDSPSVERSSANVAPSGMAPVEPPHTAYLATKRMIDIVGAVALLIVLAPVTVVAAIVVLINDGTPILFWQKRPGQDGTPLRIYKFRTMRRLHDAQGQRQLESERTSLIGRFLRRTRIDELPQLYQVLVGEMSFVGPRPLLKVDQTLSSSLRLSVRPGITGLAQVSGGNRLSIEEKMAIDLWYVRNVSLRLDTMILFGTMLTLLRGERRDEAMIAKYRAEVGMLRDGSAERSRGADPTYTSRT